jgi:hypothetical protein
VTTTVDGTNGSHPGRRTARIRALSNEFCAARITEVLKNRV